MATVPWYEGSSGFPLTRGESACEEEAQPSKEARHRFSLIRGLVSYLALQAKLLYQ